MKSFYFYLCCFGWSFAQAPKDWRLIVPPKPTLKEQSHFLGRWESPDGTTTVQAKRYRKTDQPLAIMLGMEEIPKNNSADIDLSLFPIKAKLLDLPNLGLEFQLAPKDDLFRERIWLQTSGGGTSIEINHQKENSFKLSDWSFGSLPKEDEHRLMLHYEKLLKEITPLLEGPPEVKINQRLKPPIIDNSKKPPGSPRLVVTIHEDGEYSIDGEKVSEEQLMAAMTSAARRDPNTVLYLQGDAKAEFRFARKAIRMGSKAGLSQVAFGANTNKETAPEE